MLPSIKKTKKIIAFVSFAIVVLIVFALFPKNTVIESTPIDRIKIFTLSKNIEVYLNRNSKIEYKEDPLGGIGTIHLLGEAYIKNTKNYLLSVITTFGTLETSNANFNIKSRNDFFQVDCNKGILKIQLKNELKQLSEGDVFQILVDKQFQSKTNKKHPTWILQESKFNEAPFFEVVNELERFYGIKIVLKNVDVGKPYTGTLTLANLEEALKTISKSLDLNYRIFDKKVVITQFNP